MSEGWYMPSGRRSGQLDEAVHDLVDAQVGGVELDRVGDLRQRARGPAAVQPVTTRDVRGHRGHVAADLAGPPARPRLRARRQVDLRTCRRPDDRADVAPLDDDPAVADQRPLRLD